MTTIGPEGAEMNRIAQAFRRQQVSEEEVWDHVIDTALRAMSAAPFRSKWFWFKVAWQAGRTKNTRRN